MATFSGTDIIIPMAHDAVIAFCDHNIALQACFDRNTECCATLEEQMFVQFGWRKGVVPSGKGTLTEKGCLQFSLPLTYQGNLVRFGVWHQDTNIAVVVFLNYGNNPMDYTLNNVLAYGMTVGEHIQPE